ncbi:DUF4097 and DUF4098 domain-containing protein YvlB [Peribacillus sp. B2I2]|jgi:DUF4097 and DUF4098 domain-containing protein YvlB|uniref:DUF4097 family beta strand repeat-containing protein n=1 Tax=unclassified Peribacillus TaxID=2675266 RepID=UPI0025A14048|nr:DUF4097 family beta strand repeat-containing protein [Peribacillus sp. ACCC06369]MDM5357140.1 DUF4097 family beta strand repeat-containing protein [Peribacillus sp. ACCC06369]
MINAKKLSIIALVLLLVGVIGSLFTFSQVMDQKATTEEKTISEIVTDVQIDTDNAVVEILPTKDKETRIELVSKGVNVSKLDFTADVEGKKLSVKLEDRSTFSFGFHIQSLHLKVFVPDKSYKSFVVESDNGKMQISGLKSENLMVESQNGRVELNDIVTEKVEVKSANGKLDLNNVEGKLVGSSNNGKITLVTKDLDRMIDLECNNGKIMIKTENEPTNTTFDVHVDNGKVDILGKHEGNTVIGKGENLVKLEANNGKIEITK